MLVSVNTTPQQITQDGWGETTIYNNGPSTVYLDDNSSVGAGTGISLSPNASTVWRSGHVVWGVCPNDLGSNSKATLSVARANIDITDSRTFVDNILCDPYIFTGSQVSRTIETAPYSTIKVSLDIAPSIGFHSDRLYVVANWYDSDMRFISQSNTDGYISAISTVFHLAVKGAYAKIFVSSNAFTLVNNASVYITGSTRVQDDPAYVTSYPAVRILSGTDWVLEREYDYGATITVGSGQSGVVQLQPKSRSLTLSISGTNLTSSSGTNTPYISVRGMTDFDRFGGLPVSLSAQGIISQGTYSVPSGVQVRLVSFGANIVSPNTISLGIVWN